MDIIGYASFTVPFLGEFSDLIWAPVSAFLFYRMFGGWKASIGAAFNFLEEILPFTDFIPTFTLAWIWQYVGDRKRPVFNPATR